jgi:hypothetical protein
MTTGKEDESILYKQDAVIWSFLLEEKKKE